MYSCTSLNTIPKIDDTYHYINTLNCLLHQRKFSLYTSISSCISFNLKTKLYALGTFAWHKKAC